MFEIIEKFPFVDVFYNPNPQGSAYVRFLGISKAKYNVLLFTDDDCIVPINWVEKLYRGVVENGIVTGNLKSIEKFKIISLFEQYIDYIRIRALDSNKNIKFISFSNFGLKYNLLPLVPFDTCSVNTTEDFDLGCRLRLNNKKICFDEQIILEVCYPITLIQIIRRKIKHAKGIAYLEMRYGKKNWDSLEIGTKKELIKRWTNISFSAPFSLSSKCLFYIVNMTFCFSLCYYSKKFKNVKRINF